MKQSPEQYIRSNVCRMAVESGLTEQQGAHLGEYAIQGWRQGRIPTASKIEAWAKKQIKELSKVAR